VIASTHDQEKLDEAKIKATRYMKNVLADAEAADKKKAEEEVGAKQAAKQKTQQEIREAQEEWVAKRKAMLNPADQSKHAEALEELSHQIKTRVADATTLAVIDGKAEAMVSEDKHKEYEALQEKKEENIAQIRAGGNQTREEEIKEEMQNATLARRQERDEKEGSKKLQNKMKLIEAKVEMHDAKKKAEKEKQILETKRAKVHGADEEHRLAVKKEKKEEKEVQALEELAKKPKPIVTTDVVNKETGEIEKQTVKKPDDSKKAVDAAVKKEIKKEEKAGTSPK